MRTIVSGFSIDETRALVSHAKDVLSGDSGHYTSQLLDACETIIYNFEQIIDDALKVAEQE